MSKEILIKEYSPNTCYYRYHSDVNTKEHAFVQFIRNEDNITITNFGSSPPRKGLGSELLRKLNEEYSNILVNASHDDAVPFWKKMIERNLIKNVIHKHNF